MFVGMPGLSPVPELATSLFQLCKRSGGTSLTKPGKIFAKGSFCHSDLEHGICKRNYLWSCAANLLHGSSAVKPAYAIPVKDPIGNSLLFFSHERAPFTKHCASHTEILGASGCLSSCYGRKELPDIKPPNEKYLWVWRKGNSREINNFLVISLSIYRNHPMKGVSMQRPVHLGQNNQMYLDCWQRSSPTAATNFTWGKVNN